MAPSPDAVSRITPPASPGRKRSATTFIKSIVSPSKPGHKKALSVSLANSNPLNSYMKSSNGAPMLPPIETSTSFLPPLNLDPPVAPFTLENNHRRMHKKSISSISLASFKSKKGVDLIAASPRARGSIDFSTLRDLVQPNRSDLTNPQKSPKKPGKSKSIIDISILRGIHRERKEDSPLCKNDKENQSPFRSGFGPGASCELGFVTTPIYRYSMDLPMGPGTSSGVDAYPTSNGVSSTRISRENCHDLGRSTQGSSTCTRKSPHECMSHCHGRFVGYAACTGPQEIIDPKSSVEFGAGQKKIFALEANVTSNGSTATTARNSAGPLSSSEKLVREASAKSVALSPVGTLTSGKNDLLATVSLDGINVAYEALLDARGVPEHMRARMRGLDVRVKQEFIQKEKQMETGEVSGVHLSQPIPSALAIFGKRPRTAGEKEIRPKSKGDDGSTGPKKTRPRSRTFGKTKDKMDILGSVAAVGTPISPTKRPRSGEQAIKGAALLLPVSTNAIGDYGPKSPTMVPTFTTDEWVDWLQAASRKRNFGNRMFVEDIERQFIDKEVGMKDVELAVLHKLRLVLRNEPLRWVEGFLKRGGLDKLWKVIERVLGVEWREDHEDMLLHELFLCIKAVCTASLGLKQLADMEMAIFPRLLDLIFDEEKKGPSEFNTRGVIISLLNSHLAAAPASQRPLRTRRVLGYLTDKIPKKRSLDFIEIAHTNRPYRRWCKELSNVTKEVFWIFLHGSNIIPLLPASSLSLSYCERNFPQERPPVPAAPYVGGVEWEATNYLASHMDLLNACIASLAGRDERNDLRMDLKNSGWERVMGGALRTCKEKLHAHIHDGLKTWVRAAAEDEWYVGDVRFGPRVEPKATNSSKGNQKKEAPPPKLELGLGLGFEDKLERRQASGGWKY